MLGTRIIESQYMYDERIDTSGCRSPSRAMRRWRKRGIRGRLDVKHIPKPYAMKLPDGSLVMHPVMAAELRKQVPKAPERSCINPLYMHSS